MTLIYNYHTDKMTNSLLRGFLIPIINTTFIELSTTAYLRLLFLSTSYPKTQPLVHL